MSFAAAAMPVQADPEQLQEADRLEAVDRLDVLDTPPDPAFDALTRLVRATFNVSIAVVSVVDGHRQWFKACEGLPATEIPRRDSFCRYTIRQTSTLVVPDALLDPRFADNPNVIGDPFVRFYAGVPLLTREGHAVGTLCAIDTAPRPFGPKQVAMLEDFASLAIAQLELRQHASTDILTGALTRRAFMEAARRAVGVAKRQRTDLAVIVVDLDHFKAINDTYGHGAGDAVLAGAAASMTETIRETDIVGRLGGEEFGVVVHTGRQGALELAERMRVTLERQTFDMGGTRVGVTASFGIAALDRGMPDVETLIAHADAALYDAKNAGRNRAVLWRGEPGQQGSLRRKVFKAGQIVFFNRSSTVDCTVRSLGKDGANLDVSATAGIPETFTLIIRSDQIESRCRIVSRTDRTLDVEFV